MKCKMETPGITGGSSSSSAVNIFAWGFGWGKRWREERGGWFWWLIVVVVWLITSSSFILIFELYWNLLFSQIS